MTGHEGAVRPFVIRRADLGDAEGIARVHVASWKETYTGRMDPVFLNSLRIAPRFEHWARVLSGPPPPWAHVALDTTGRVVGFASGGPELKEDEVYRAELYSIYVLREAQGQGLGHRLLASVVADLVGAGYESMLVWVLEGNPFRSFFERMGGVPERWMTQRFGEEDQRLVAYGWPELKRAFPERSARSPSPPAEPFG